MAFIEKRGSRYAVKQGNTGKTLSTFGSRASAQKEVDRLHRKNMPSSASRGASARRKFGAKAKRKRKRKG